MTTVLDPNSDSGASEGFQSLPVAYAYPHCRLCTRHPHVHALRGAALYCDAQDGSPKGDFGPGATTTLVIACVYADIGRKLPEGLRNEVVRLRNQGITSW